MQETKEIKVPVSGKLVLIKGYVTGLIDQEVKKALMGGFQMEAPINDVEKALENAGQNIKINLSAQIDADSKLLEHMVLAIDGNNGDVFKRLMDLPAQDVEFVKNEVKKLQEAGNLSDPKETA